MNDPVTAFVIGLRVFYSAYRYFLAQKHLFKV